MSITDLMNNKGLGALVARADAAYAAMGITGKDRLRCIELTIRYGLGAARLGNDNPSADLYRAIAHVASHQVSDLVTGAATSAPQKRRLANPLVTPASSTPQPYWVDKVCEVLGIDTWLDDSLAKWFLDTHGPFADIIVQACRRRVMDYLAACATSGTPVNHDDLVIDIVHDLQARFPALARFARHLPGAIATTIEQDVLGIPLVDKVEPATIPAITGATSALASGTAARASYSTNYPDSTSNPIDPTTTTTTTSMRPTYP
ncbi:MAG: hypothetical protein GYA24_03885 [Candidatus Lokiarchaeota archaeon]|nr:hypothetical protein [Candidatus Lokiarchaeota archaeon]